MTHILHTDDDIKVPGTAHCDKPDLGLLPLAAVWEVGRVMTVSSKKHADDGTTWTKAPLTYMYFLHKILRHVLEWAMGSDKDKESGLHPLAHAAADCLLCLELALKSPAGRDNRLKWG